MITSLYLKNFKCFSSLEKDIGLKQITLLTGSNGRGKSSIFQSLLLLGQSYKSGKNIDFIKLNGRFISLGSFNDVLHRSSQEKVFEIGFKTDDEDENKALLVCGEKEGNPRLADLNSLRITYNDNSIKEYVNRVGGDDENSDSVSGKSATSDVKAINQLRNIHYISADRQGPKNYVTRTEDIVSNNIGVHGEYVIHALKDDNNLISNVKQALSMIMGGASIDVKDIDTEYIKLLLDSSDSENGYKPVNVGFGYSYILPVVALPLIVDAGSKLFIENPEAHLHPGAQSRLMDYLIKIAKERNLQLFIETHSDHIVNALRVSIKNKSYALDNKQATIVHVGRDTLSNQSTFWQINIDREGNLSDYPCDFMDEWTKQMVELV